MHDCVILGKELRHYEQSTHKMSNREGVVIEQIYERVDFFCDNEITMSDQFPLLICTK